MSTTKTCSECGKTKPTDDFGLARTRPDGLNNRCRPCNLEYARAWRLRNKDRERVRALGRYGMSLDDYDRLFARQRGRCAICSTTKGGGRGPHLHVDHCHDSGRIRGLLCNNCNRGLGLLGDSAEALAAASSYLTTNEGEAQHGPTD